MRYILSLVAGVILGAAAWWLGFVLSGTFEPFDSTVGFLTTQVVMGAAALLVGRRSGGTALMVLLLGEYLGLNLYPYVFGGPEARAWWPLGAVTTIALLVLPGVLGAAGLAARRLKRKGVH